MSQASPCIASPSGYNLNSHLPPLVDRRRYPHEISQPKPIREDKRADVLQELQNFYATVLLNGRTLSEGSRTTAQAQSITSNGTSMTGMTTTFSLDDQPVQGDRLPVPLDPILKARKALLRKLKACQDCASRRVMCKLWHHALRDLLQSPQNSGFEAIVEWAIRFDAEPGASPTSAIPDSTHLATFAAGEPSEARDRVVNQATNFFDVPFAPPMLYGSGIQETTASLLDHSGVTQPRSRADESGTIANVPSPPFSTLSLPGMFPFGMRDDTFGPNQYKCEWKDCPYTAPEEDLILHFEIAHICFQRLRYPLRIVCLPCGSFHTQLSVQCCLGIGRTMVEKVYGLYLPDEYSGPVSENGAIHSGLSGFESVNGQGNYFLHDQTNGSLQGNSGYPYCDDSRSGGSLCAGSPYYSLRSMANYWKKGLSWLSVPYRLLRRFARGRRYTVAFIVAIAISLLFGHDWILSKLARFNGRVPNLPHLNLPVIGIVVMSLAFAVHRFIVHVHFYTGGSRRGSWLSQCALNMFNVACGRTLESIEPYELGDSRS